MFVDFRVLELFMSEVKDVLELALEPKPGAAVGENPEGSKAQTPPKKDKTRCAPSVPRVVPDMPGAGSPLH